MIDRLGLIALGRAAGFSLDEIARMFASNGPPRIAPRIDRKLLAAKADELDEKIRELGAMRDGLRHAAACPAPSHLECRTFRRLLRAAAEGVIRAPKGRLGVAQLSGNHLTSRARSVKSRPASTR